MSNKNDIDISTHDIIHETELVAVVEADIDKDIKPLIIWMNSLWDINTLFCCQGTNRDPKIQGSRAHSPYVLFLCSSSLSLIKISNMVKAPGTEIEVEFYEPLGGLRYHLRFRDHKALMKCISYLPGSK